MREHPGCSQGTDGALRAGVHLTSEAGPSRALCHLLIKEGDRAPCLKELSSQVLELLCGGDSTEEFP